MHLPIRPVPIKEFHFASPSLSFFPLKILTLGRLLFNKISNFPIQGYNKLLTKEGINGKVRILLAGLAGWASLMLQTVHSIPEAEVVAVCSIVQEEL